MTVWQAITQADAMRHNSYDQEQKVRWLSRLDWKIRHLIMQQPEDAVFNGYDPRNDLHRDLLVAAPFEEIYLYWLEAQICYADGELADYNSAIAQYNRLYEAFAADYNRSHMPCQRGTRFLY